MSKLITIVHASITTACFHPALTFLSVYDCDQLILRPHVGSGTANGFVIKRNGDLGNRLNAEPEVSELGECHAL